MARTKATLDHASMIAAADPAAIARSLPAPRTTTRKSARSPKAHTKKRSPGRPALDAHIVWRKGRAYADVRVFKTVLDDNEKSGRIALIAEGESFATTDPEIAHVLFTRKLAELRERSRTKVSTGRWKSAPLKAYAARHLELKAKSGNFTYRWLSAVEKHLAEAIAFFGADRDLAAIKPTDVAAYVEHLARIENGRGKQNGKRGRLTTATQRKYLNSLSNVYRRAISNGHASVNPVAQLMDKPVAAEHDARWLEVPDGALLLEACRTYEPNGNAPGESISGQMLHAIVATFLLTGGRMSEVFGLLVGDVSFERGKVTFRNHPHRRLKTRNSKRSVPLWPQLRAVLVPWLAQLEQDELRRANEEKREPAFGPDSLLFPSVRGTGYVRDIRKALDAAAARVGWKDGEIRTKMFRHTYTAARLQTANRIIRRDPATGKLRSSWIPVSRDEVARELGHGGTSLVAKVYGHVGEVKHRSEVPEFLVANHAEQLAPRLKLIRIGAA